MDDKEANSQDSMIWGKGYWLLIWTVLYDTKRFPLLTDVKEYIDLIARNLPCGDCRNHIMSHMNTYNIMTGNDDREFIKKFFIRVYMATARTPIKIDSVLASFLDEKFPTIK